MNWKDINIRKGKQLYELDKDDFYKNNEIEKLTQQLCIILEKDVIWVESLPLNDVFNYQNELSFLKEPPSGNFENEVVIDGIKYKMINLSKLKFGEWIDLDTYSKDVFGQLERIMAVLYRPEGDVYNPSSVEDRSLIFLDKMSYEMAAGVALFFSLLEMGSIEATKDYSLLEMVMMDLMKKREKLKKDLQSDHQMSYKKKKQKKSSSGS